MAALLNDLWCLRMCGADRILEELSQNQALQFMATKVRFRGFRKSSLQSSEFTLPPAALVHLGLTYATLSVPQASIEDSFAVGDRDGRERQDSGYHSESARAKSFPNSLGTANESAGHSEHNPLIPLTPKPTIAGHRHH